MKNDPPKIDLWEVSKIKPYEKNAKQHPDEQIDRLAKTIQRFGWDQPIVVDGNGVIIKGHGRRLAAIKLGMKKVPVIVRADMTTAEADAARISDNAVVGLKFDTRTMQEEINRILAIEDVSLDLDHFGLTEKEQELFLNELNTPVLDSIMKDTHGEIEEQKRQDKERVKEIDAQDVSVVKVFGFKTISKEEERIFNNFLAEAEAATDETGRKALFSYMKKVNDLQH